MLRKSALRGLVMSVALLAAVPARALVDCAVTGGVTRTVPGTDATITAALGNLPGSLSGPACINILDSGIYVEQVDVRNFVNNGSSITIQAMPGQFPSVSPPAASTAAFVIANASVNVLGISVMINQKVPYGVWASSGYVQLSSVSVSTGTGVGGIYEAGVRISSWSAISYTSVTVGDAHGVWFDAALGTTISFSTAVNNGPARYALFLQGGNKNAFSVVFASNSYSTGIVLYALNSDTNTVTQSFLMGRGGSAFLSQGSDYNTISFSTMSSGAPSSAALQLDNADFNTVTDSYMGSPSGYGAYLDGGSHFNTISLSTMASSSSSDYALYLMSADSNTVTGSYLSNFGGDAAFLGVAANYNTISFSTMISNAPGGYAALWINGASRNTIMGSRMSNPNGYGLHLNAAAKHNTISLSTMVSASGGHYGLLSTGASSNTVSLSYISNGAGTSAKFSAGGFNAISGSTIVATTGSPYYALHLLSSSSNTLNASVVSHFGPAGAKGVYIELESNGNSIVSSSIAAFGAAVTFDRTSSNTVVGSFLEGFSAAIVVGSTGTRVVSSRLQATSSGYGLHWKDGSSGLTLSASTVTTGSSGVGLYSESFNGGAVEVIGNFVAGANCSVCFATTTVGSTLLIASNTLIPGQSGTGLQVLVLDGLLYGATIQNNNLYFRSGGGIFNMDYRGMVLINSLGLVIERNRINHPGVLGNGNFKGALFDNVRDTVFRFNDVHSSGTLGGASGSYLLTLINSTVSVRNNVFLSSMTGNGSVMINAGTTSGPAFDYNAYHNATGDTTLSWGASFTFPWGANAGIDRHSISGDPLWAQTVSGFEDFHPRSTIGRFNPATQLFVTDGVDSPTLDYGDPAEAFGLEPAPNGGAVNPGSYGNTLEASKSPTPPCPVTRKVCKNGSCPFTTIQSAVDNLPSPLPGYACVYIQDSSVYNEQVVVENIVNNGSSITIRLDPALTVRPYVRPSVAALPAAFVIRNSSVNIVNINVAPNIGMSYGIFASSANVAITSVTVTDPENRITVAGVALSSWSAVSYSSVVVGGTDGLLLSGVGSLIADSTMTNAGANPQGALRVIRASSNSITRSYIFNSNGFGVHFEAGASSNTISFSTMTSGADFYAGLYISGGSSNTVISSYMRNAIGHAATLTAGAKYNTISRSTMSASASGRNALYIVNGSSWNTISESLIVNSGGSGAWLDGADYNTISQSTMTNSAGGSNYALYLTNSDSNVVMGSYLNNPAGTVVRLTSGSDLNTIALSTMVSSAATYHAIYIMGSDSNTVTGSYAQNLAGYGAFLTSGADFNTIALSTMVSNAISYSAIYIVGSDRNTVTGSYVQNLASYGASLASGADFNTIALSTMVSNAAVYSALYVSDSDSNTVTGSYVQNLGGIGARLDAGADFNTVSLSTMIAGAPALHLLATTSNTVSSSYIQGSSGAVVSGSTGTFIGSSYLLATNAAGGALALQGGSGALSVASSTLRGGASGAGFLLGAGNSGVVSIGSVTVTGSARGLEISTQAFGFILSVDSVTFRGLAAGATAIHYLGGTFRSTFTLANFEDTGVGANVSAAALDPASRVVMFAHYGARTGPAFENDPNALVGWEAGPQPGCVVTANVGAGQPYGSITEGLAALPTTLTGHSCVVIRDGATYNEQVTVANFTNNGSSITIMADPTASTVAPRVIPPGISAAAFRILNSSVNIVGIEVKVLGGGASYGLYVSSPYVTISSVIVSDPSSMISIAGISLSSWTTVSYTTVTVQNAIALWLQGTNITVSYSSATNSTAGGNAAVQLTGASASTLTGLVARNQSQTAVRFDGGGGNVVSLSSFTSSNGSGLHLNGSSTNTISGTWMSSGNGYGLKVESSNRNIISQSTAASSGAAQPALYLVNSSSNAINGVFASNPLGYGAYLNTSSTNTLSLSTFTGGQAGNYGLNTDYGSSNVITGCYIENTNPSGIAAHFFNTSSNTLSQSTIVGGVSNYGLHLVGGSYNRIESSLMLTGAELDSTSNNNVIIASTFTHNSPTRAALRILAGSSNTVTTSFLTNPLGYGLNISGGGAVNYNAISQSTITSGDTALYLGGTGNSLVSNYIAGGTGYGAQVMSASYGSILQSTITNNSALFPAAYLWSSASNTITQSVIVNSNSAGGVLLDNGANWNSIQQSLVKGGGSGIRAQYISGLSVSLSSVTGGSSGASAGVWGDTLTEYITIANSYVQGSTGVYLNGSSRAVVTANVIAGSGGGSAFYSTGYSQTLVMSANVVLGGGLAGIGVDAGRGLIRLSTNTVIARGGIYGIAAGGFESTASLWITSNTILPSLSASATTYGIFLNQLPGGATIQNNGIYYRTPGAAFGGVGAGAYGLYASQVAGLKVDHNRISNPSMVTSGNYIGAAIDSTSNAFFRFNDLYSTGAGLTTFNLLRLTGSTNASARNNVLSSSMTATVNRMIVVDVGSQLGFSSDFNTYFSSNASYSGVWGVGAVSFLANWIVTTGRDANSLSTNPRWVNPSGEDFHPLSREGRWNGAAFVSDAVDSPVIDRADPAEVIGLEEQPNGARANQGSYGQSSEASQTVLPCPVTRYVRKAGDGDSTTIQGGIAALPNPIVGGHSCVIIGDSGIYDEAVTVQGFTNNGSSITIMLDPSLTVHPIVRQGFVIRNASVSVVNIDVMPNALAVSYGILASSANIALSSVNIIDPGGFITAAGVALSSYSALSFSSIAVQGAHGLRLDGKFAVVINSTMTNNSGSFNALYLSGADSNTVTGSYISNPLGYGAVFQSGADYNTISQSTATSGAVNYVALYLDGSSRNTVTGAYLEALAGHGATMGTGANYNTISFSTMVSNDSNRYGYYLVGADYNMVTGSLMQNLSGSAATLQTGSDNNTISLSTMIANAGGRYALYVLGSDSNTVTGSYLSNPLGRGAYLSGGADYNTINQSTMTSGATSEAALDIVGSGFNTVAGSFISNPACYGVRLAGGANNNAISLSTMASDAAGYFALYITGSSSNAVTGSLAVNAAGTAVSLESGANYNTISQSTMTSAASSARALNLFSSDFNTISGNTISNPAGEGARLASGSDFNLISQSTVTSAAAGFFALVIGDSSSNTVHSCYVQGSSAAVISNSTGTGVLSSVLIATNTAGTGLTMRTGSFGLAMSSNTIQPGTHGKGVYLDSDNGGTIVLSTNTIRGGRHGVYVSTQLAGTALWISSNTILPVPTAAFDTYGIFLNGLLTGATIQNNGIYYRTPVNTSPRLTAGLGAYASAGLVVSGNRISNPGMVTGDIANAFIASTDNTIFTFNDFHSTGTSLANAYMIYLENSPGTKIHNNAFSSSWTVTSSSSAIGADTVSQSGFASNYNSFFSSNSFNTIKWGAITAQFPWVSAIGHDEKSIAKHPRWKNPSAGAEDFHLLSQAGRWDGAGFVSDGFTSALIDSADPAKAFASEAAPNGSRANLGSYGNTPEASKTPAPPTSPLVTAVFASSVAVSYGLVAADGYVVGASTMANMTGTLLSSITANGALAALAPQGLSANTTYFIQTAALWGDFAAVSGVQLATATLANSPAPRDPAFGEVNISSLTAVWLPNGPTVGIGTYTVVLTTGAAYPNAFAGNQTFSTSPAFDLGANSPPGATRSGLTPNTTYFVFVAALNWNSMPSSFTSVGSTPTLADMPATAVTTFSAVGFSSFTVSWSANGNPLSITTYTVQLSTASDFNAFATSVTFSTAPAFGPSATFTGLGPNEHYYFRVRARNHQGVETAYAVLGSTLTRPVTLSAPVIAGLVTVTNGSISATWGLTALATGYNLVASLVNDPSIVAASSSPIGITATTATVSTGITANTTYYLFVQALGPGAVTGFSAYPATATLANTPLTAVSTFSGVNLTSMTVSWLPNGNPVGVTSYTVVLSTGAAYPNSFFGNRSVSTAPAGAAPTASIIGLSDNTQYYLYVAGVNHNGLVSAFTALGSTVTRIAAPTTVVFDEISSNTIVASAYAPTPLFSNLGLGQSGTQISRNGTYQPVHGEAWVSTTALPAPLSEAGAAGFNSLVYIFGGINGGAVQKTARVYDPANNTWSSLPDISSTRYGIAGAFAGGKIYAVGGTPDGGASLTVNEEYDPVANAWTTKAVLPTAADHLSAVGVGGAVYAFGGVNGGTEIDQTVQFDPAANAWTVRPVFPVTQTQMAAAAAAGPGAGTIIAAGGGGPTNSNYGYNTAANTWSGKALLPAAVEQGAAASMGGKIYVIGGAPAAQTVYEYDVAADTWVARSSMITGRAGLSAVAAGGHIYALGGSADGGGTSLTVNEAYDPGVATKFAGLTPNTLVNFRARARNQSGTLSAQTATISTYTWAALPGTVAAPFTVVAVDSITFTWALNNNPAGTEFKTRASTSSTFGGGAAVLASDWGGMISTGTLGLSPNTTYFFQSAARNGVGGVPGIQTAWVSFGSTATLAAVPLSAPTPFPSAATNGLTVSWLPNGNPLSITTYTVVVSTDAAYPNAHTGNFTIASTQPAGGLPTSTFTGLIANTTYFAFAAARNWNGLYTAFAALGSTSTLALPPAAAAPTYAAVHESSATFSWLPNGNPVNVTTYSVVLSTGSSFNSFAGNVGFSTTPAGSLPTATASAGLIPNTTYYGYAAAINSNGAASAYTSLGSTATLAALPATVVSTFSAVNIGSFTVSWSAGGNPLVISSYTVQLSTDSFATIAVSFTTAPAAGPSATFSGLDDYKDYFFRVRAVNHGGNATAFVALGSTRTLLAPLLVPATAGFVSVDIASITATWGLVTGATGYTLVASSYPANPPTVIAASSSTFAIAATTAAALLPALEPNTTYYLFVRANGPLRSSLFAAYGATSTLANPPATAVSTFTGVGITSFTVSWSANGNALAITTFTVQLSTAPDFNAFATSVTVTTAPVFGPSTMITGLSGNTSYYLRVRALNHNGVPSAYVALGSTLTVASPLFPTILNSQTGDVVWRRANTALYSTAFLDTSGSHLDKFQVKASTTAGGLGTDIAPLTDVLVGLSPLDSYSTPWSLPVSVFNALQEGVTNYISIKVFNGPPLNNFTFLQDAFYVQKDTTSPVIVNTQTGDSVARSAAGTTYTVGVRDPSSGLAAFQYSASLAPGTANAALIGWTNIAAVANTTSYTTPWPVDFAQLVSGVTNYISVRSWDTAGATTTVTDAFFVHKDTTGPSVAIATPQSASFNSSLGQLSGTAASIYGVKGTEVSIRDTVTGFYWNPAGSAFNSGTQIMMAASGTTAWTLTPGIPWIDGRTYQAVARSSTTANIYSTIYATATFVMDLSTPTVGVLAPAPNSTVAVLPYLSGTAVDPAPNPSGLATVEVRLRRNADGLWWNWFAQTWGVTAVSSVTSGTTAWSLTPTLELKASLDDGASYFIAVRASDNALPANTGDFFVSGATFTWQDVTPPSAVADLAASHGAVPGSINLSWTAPGDDAGAGAIALGEYRIFYSTDIAAVASTSAAQVVIATAAVYPGTAQSYTLVSLSPSATYYVRLALNDGDDNWSNFSNQATTTAAPSPVNAITGHVLDISTQGITAVQVDCWNAADALMGTTFTLADGSGTYTVNGLPPGSYKLRVTWTVNGFSSSLWQDGITMGSTNVDFFLNINYALATLTGTLSTLTTSSFGGGGVGTAAADSFVELYQQGRQVARATVSPGGRWSIPGLLPGTYSVRAHTGLGYTAFQDVELAEGEVRVLGFVFDPLPEASVFNFPNPARTATTIRFESALFPLEAGIYIFDLAGSLVKEFSDSQISRMGGGLHHVVWNLNNASGQSVAPGVYNVMVKIRGGSDNQSAKVIKKLAVVR